MVPFEVSIAGLEDPSLRVLSFSGHESLSQTYSYTIDLVSRDDGLALEDLIGKNLKLQINDAEGLPQRWLNGVIANFQQAESSVRQTAYRALVVPALQILSYRQDCRIFQDLSVPDIISQVFDDAGLVDYTLKLDASYSPRVYCVQYRESDLNFVARLMEDEGIFYFFEHDEEKTTLTLGDKPGAHPRLPVGDTLEHHDTGGGLAEGDFVFGIRWQEAITTNAVMLRDFDFKKPSVDHLQLNKEVDQYLKLEQYDYPGVYEDPDTGHTRIGTRLDALQSGRQQVTASTTVRRLFPGHTFTLTQHPNPRFNRDFVITRVSHNGRSAQVLEQDQGGGESDYHCQFSAAPAETVQRQAASARRPRVEGVQTAIVVGPSGEEIYTDEFGRVKVQFHWDRLGRYDEKSSCWVRVSQLWAGAGWGGMDIPRIGHEVIVSFEEGDPDRPLITGRVYHGENRPPHPLPAGKVKSTIRSNSTPGGGGFNELTFDDTKGEEEVFLHSQYNTTVATGNDKNQSTVNDESLTVGHDRTKTVSNDEINTIEHDRTTTVVHNETTTVENDRVETIHNNDTKTVKSGLCKVEVNEGDHQLLTTLGEQKIDANKRVYIHSNNLIELETGDSKITMEKNGSITITCKKMTIAADELCTLSADTFSATGYLEAKVNTGTQVVKTNALGVETSGASITSAAVGTHIVNGAIVKIN